MNQPIKRKPQFALCAIAMAFASSIASFNSVAADNTTPPPGFYTMPDGRIMAKDISNAVAPPGYFLRRNGTLVKIDHDDDNSPPPPPAAPIKPGEVPPGFHKMPDGRIMANDPKTAIIPPGYHIMPNGVLMSNTGMGGSSGGHHHGKGMWMFDYKFSRMYMKDLLDTTKRITPQQAVDPNGNYKYMMAPVDMTMDMHMLMIMYGITDKVMPMLMLHYMSNEMGMYTNDGTRSTMTSSGIADTIISAMIQGPHKLNFDVGLSIPTGSIDIKGRMVHGTDEDTGTLIADKRIYGYGMQMGSGSFELIHGIRYEDYAGDFGWGGSYSFTAPLNKNKADYKRGDKLLVDGWLQWSGINALAIKGKLQYRSIGQIEGVDERIEASNDFGNGLEMSPAADASAYGGNRLDATAIIAYKIPSPMITFTFEFTKPVYQNLWGPQMATDWIASMNIGLMIH